MTSILGIAGSLRSGSYNTRPWCGGRLLVSWAQHVFNDTGAMTDEAVRAVARLPAWIRPVHSGQYRVAVRASV